MKRTEITVISLYVLFSIVGIVAIGLSYSDILNPNPPWLRYGGIMVALIFSIMAFWKLRFRKQKNP